MISGHHAHDLPPSAFACALFPYAAASALKRPAQVTHTRASLGHVHVVGGINEEAPEPFKMARFRNVRRHGNAVMISALPAVAACVTVPHCSLSLRSSRLLQVPSRLHMH